MFDVTRERAVQMHNSNAASLLTNNTSCCCCCCCCSLQEQYNTIFDCVFVPVAAAGGQEGLLLTAHESGDVRCGLRCKINCSNTLQGLTGALLLCLLLHAASPMQAVQLATGLHSMAWREDPPAA
jgi:hypothetical protein